METTLQKPALVAARTTAKAMTIAYWIVTALFCLQMTFTAYAQLRLPQVAQAFAHLGFPAYFRVELSWFKLLGVLLLLVPVPARLKEWVYAGFAIDLGSALIAHFSVGDGPAGVGMGGALPACSGRCRTSCGGVCRSASARHLNAKHFLSADRAQVTARPLGNPGGAAARSAMRGARGKRCAKLRFFIVSACALFTSLRRFSAGLSSAEAMPSIRSVSRISSASIAESIASNSSAGLRDLIAASTFLICLGMFRKSSRAIRAL